MLEKICGDNSVLFGLRVNRNVRKSNHRAFIEEMKLGI